MEKKELKEFIKKTKEEYRKIGYVECPAFPSEKIYFNKYGFNHMIRKYGSLRTPDEQMRRLELFRYVTEILRTSNQAHFYKTDNVDNQKADFWTAKGKIDGMKIKIVIRQFENGRKHFFSVMDKQ